MKNKEVIINKILTVLLDPSQYSRTEEMLDRNNDEVCCTWCHSCVKVPFAKDATLEDAKTIEHEEDCPVALARSVKEAL